MNNFDSEYSIQKQILGEIGGDTSKNYDSPYQIQLAILDAVKGGGGGGGAVIDDLDISTGKTWSSYKINNELSGAAHIDDNNVSTGTVFSSAKCEGSSYYDISTYISSQINLWQFFQDASNALQDTSTRVYLRDGENLWVDVEMFPLSSHKHVDVGNVSEDDVAVIVRYYNTSATNITQDGEWFRIYAQYAYNHDTMEIYDYANFMWGYYPYNDEAMAG